MKDREIKILVTKPNSYNIELDRCIDMVSIFCGAHLNIKQRCNMGIIWYNAYSVLELNGISKHKIIFTYKTKHILSVDIAWPHQLMAFIKGYMYYPTYYKLEKRNDVPLTRLYGHIPNNDNVHWIETRDQLYDDDAIVQRMVKVASNPPPTVPDPALRSLDALIKTSPKPIDPFLKAYETSIS
jgi:hypothetical protein